jgi:hypothetical protein
MAFYENPKHRNTAHGPLLNTVAFTVITVSRQANGAMLPALP